MNELELQDNECRPKLLSYTVNFSWSQESYYLGNLLSFLILNFLLVGENGVLCVLRVTKKFGADSSEGLLKEAISLEHRGAPLDNQECRPLWYL